MLDNITPLSLHVIRKLLAKFPNPAVGYIWTVVFHNLSCDMSNFVTTAPTSPTKTVLGFWFLRKIISPGLMSVVKVVNTSSLFF